MKNSLFKTSLAAFALCSSLLSPLALASEPELDQAEISTETVNLDAGTPDQVSEELTGTGEAEVHESTTDEIESVPELKDASTGKAMHDIEKSLVRMNAEEAKSQTEQAKFAMIVALAVTVALILLVMVQRLLAFLMPFICLAILSIQLIVYDMVPEPVIKKLELIYNNICEFISAHWVY